MIKIIIIATIILQFSISCRAEQEGARGIPSSMTPDEKIGQIIMYGYTDTSFTEKAASDMEKYMPGGFVLFGGRSVASRAQAAQLTGKLQRKALLVGAKIPLLLSIDQEAGVGNHINGVTGGIDTPGNLGLGASGDTKDVYDTYRVMADDLDAFGFNMSLSPVLDILLNKESAYKSVRSFGADPAKNAELAGAAVRAFHDGGIIAAPKHFPGSGETPLDPHKGTPNNEVPKDIILQPFMGAVAAGADVLMLGSEIYMKIDPDNVNNTSRVIMTDIARGELGFKGMILTGSITMSRNAMHAGTGELVVRALLAGADMILFAGSDTKDLDDTFKAVKDALKSGRLSTDRLDDAVLHVLQLKLKYDLWNRKPTPAAEYEAKRKKNKQTMRDIARRTVSVLKNTDGLLPLEPGQGPHILVVCPQSWFLIPGLDMLYPVGTTLATEISKVAPGISTSLYNTNSIVNDIKSALEKANKPEVEIIIFGSLHGYWSDDIARFARELKRTGKKLVVVGMSSPWDAEKMPEADAFVAANGFKSVSLLAAAELTFGKIKATAGTPVKIDVK